MRYAIRTLFNNPGFALAAIVTLALGIGATTAIFSAVDVALLRPLPFRDPARLMTIFETHPVFAHLGVSYPDYLDWQREADAFERISAYSGRSFQLVADSEPSEVAGTLVNDNFLETLGIVPQIGRNFTKGEDNAILITDSLWRTRFHSDPQIAGKSVQLDGQNFRIIGVLPSPQILPRGTDLLAPMSLLAEFDKTNRLHHVAAVVGRLKPNYTEAQATAQIRAINQRLAREFQATNGPISGAVEPLTTTLSGDARTPLFVLLVIVGLVLLIATANVANLLLARAAGRKKEIAIRIALGASRWQIVHQLLAESLTLAAAGGICGVALAWIATPWLRALAKGRIPRGDEIAIDARVLLFALVAAVIAGIVFGLVPAIAASKTDQNKDLRGIGRGSAGTVHGNLRAILVAGQVALAMVVLISAGLLISSLARLTGLDPGFDGHHLLTASLRLPAPKYQTQAQTDGFFQQVASRMSAKPGVEGVAFVDSLPLTDGALRTRFQVAGEPLPEPGRYPVAALHGISPNYFRLMKIPWLAGRDFTDHDLNASNVIINQTLARKHFGAATAVGRQLVLGVLSPKPQTLQIIGIVADSRDASLDSPVEPTMYLAGYGNQAAILVKTASDPLSLATALRSEIASIDPEEPLTSVRTMDSVLDTSLAGRKFSVLLISLFGALALGLAAVGLYGVVAYSVAQRTREMGLRIALGAEPGRVSRMVMGEAMKLAAAGALIGILAAAFATKALTTQLYGVGRGDPIAFGLAAGTLLFVAALGAWIPARRAMRVDPVVALREE